MQPILLGRVAGVPVFAGWSALFVLGFMVYNRGTSTSGQIAQGLLYGATIFFSILVHELGHAVVGRRLGLQPQSILLHGFGGLCSYGRRPGPRQGFYASAAGPAAGLLLGALVWGIQLGVGTLPQTATTWLLGQLLGQMVWINVFWSLFNLLPMWPLDGGHVLNHGLSMKLPGGRAWAITRTVGLVTAIGVAGIAYVVHMPFAIIVAGLSVLELLKRE